MLDAWVGPSQARRKALALANVPIPGPMRIRALIDTGASCTCVDPSILQSLNLTPTGSVPVNTPTTGTQAAVANQYDVGLMIPHVDPTTPPLLRETVAVIECQLLVAQGFHALIGRDILEGCLFIMDGGVKIFTLAY